MQKGNGTRQIKQGDVYWCEIDLSVLGRHLEKKRRPWVVVSGNMANKNSPNITIVPFSTSADATFPTHQKAWVRGRVSVALAEQVTTVGKNALGGKICRLNKKDVTKINKALKKHFGMEV